MVIEDDRIIGEMLELTLQYNGYNVYISNKPAQAINMVIEHKIDLILLDQFLFGISGTDICRELKQNKTTSKVPILMMSALDDVKSICLEAGAVDFLSKPFEKNILLSKIKEVLNQP